MDQSEKCPRCGWRHSRVYGGGGQVLGDGGCYRSRPVQERETYTYNKDIRYDRSTALPIRLGSKLLSWQGSGIRVPESH